MNKIFVLICLKAPRWSPMSLHYRKKISMNKGRMTNHSIQSNDKTRTEYCRYEFSQIRGVYLWRIYYWK